MQTYSLKVHAYYGYGRHLIANLLPQSTCILWVWKASKCKLTPSKYIHTMGMEGISLQTYSLKVHAYYGYGRHLIANLLPQSTCILWVWKASQCKLTPSKTCILWVWKASHCKLTPSKYMHTMGMEGISLQTYSLKVHAYYGYGRHLIANLLPQSTCILWVWKASHCKLTPSKYMHTMGMEGISMQTYSLKVHAYHMA